MRSSYRYLNIMIIQLQIRFPEKDEKSNYIKHASDDRDISSRRKLTLSVFNQQAITKLYEVIVYT